MKSIPVFHLCYRIWQILNFSALVDSNKTCQFYVSDSTDTCQMDENLHYFKVNNKNPIHFRNVVTSPWGNLQIRKLFKACWSLLSGLFVFFYPLSLPIKGPFLSFIMASSVTYITWIWLQWRYQTWGDGRLCFISNTEMSSTALWFLSLAVYLLHMLCCYSWHGGQMKRNTAGKPEWPFPWYLLPLALLPKVQQVVRKENLPVFSAGLFGYLKLHFWGTFECILCHELVFGMCRILGGQTRS